MDVYGVRIALWHRPENTMTGRRHRDFTRSRGGWNYPPIGKGSGTTTRTERVKREEPVLTERRKQVRKYHITSSRHHFRRTQKLSKEVGVQVSWRPFSGRFTSTGTSWTSNLPPLTLHTFSVHFGTTKGNFFHPTTGPLPVSFLTT